MTEELDSAQIPAETPDADEQVISKTDSGELQEKLNTELEIVDELFAQWRGNFSLFKTNLTSLVALTRSVSQAEDVPETVSEAMTTHNSADCADTVEDLIRVVSADSAALKKGLNRIRKALEI